jgi:hypothetical protein
VIVTIDATPRLRLQMNSETLQSTVIEHADGMPYSLHELPTVRLIELLREIAATPTEGTQDA